MLSYRCAHVAALASLVLIGGCTVESEHDGYGSATGTEAATVIDGMRSRGSFEAGRARLSDTARVIAERIAAAVPGQTWRFDDDPHGLSAARDGAPCEQLTADVARRPRADPVIFGRTFSAAEFDAAAGIVAAEAAKVGATEASPLIAGDPQRDYSIRGTGFEFTLGQINFATLTITGECLLMQKVIDQPGDEGRRADSMIHW